MGQGKGREYGCMRERITRRKPFGKGSIEVVNVEIAMQFDTQGHESLKLLM